jgi:hypothetical protein
MKEVGVGLTGCRLLEVVEAFGRWNGNDEHELIFLFEAEPDEWQGLEGGVVLGVEANGQPLEMRWVRGDELLTEGANCIPRSWRHTSSDAPNRR